MIEPLRIGTRAMFAGALALAAGCSSPPGAPPIHLGTACAACGMEIGDLSFACERGAGRSWRPYDSIECLLRDTAAPGAAWLADYDARTLHPADSLWVVCGSFPSPMGGGFAAFASRATADSVATATSGRVGRLAEFEHGGAVR